MLGSVAKSNSFVRFPMPAPASVALSTALLDQARDLRDEDLCFVVGDPVGDRVVDPVGDRVVDWRFVRVAAVAFGDRRAWPAKPSTG